MNLRFPYTLHRHYAEIEREQERARARADARAEEQWIRESLAKDETFVPVAGEKPATARAGTNLEAGCE